MIVGGLLLLVLGSADAFRATSPAAARSLRLSAVVDRVLVCGPPEGVCAAATETLARGVAEVVPGSSACDAAVVCADLGEGESPTEESDTLDSLVSSVLRRPPRRLIIVAPENQDGPKGGGIPLLGNLLGIRAERSPRELADAAVDAGVAQVAIITHGSLFGGGSGAAFEDGLKLQPKLFDDFSRRGVRVALAEADEEKKVSISGGSSTSRRASVGEAAAYAAASQGWALTGVVEFGVRSASGLEGPQDREAWDALLGDALEPSAKRPIFRFSLNEQSIDEDWLVEEWAPTALRSIDATLAVSGSRPVQAVPRAGMVAAMHWETFDGADVKRVGELLFTVEDDNQLVVRRSMATKPLPGETELLDNLADSLVQKQQKQQQKLAKAAPSSVAKAAASPPPPPPQPEKVLEAEPATAAALPKRPRRASSVRSKTATPPPPSAD